MAHSALLTLGAAAHEKCAPHAAQRMWSHPPTFQIATRHVGQRRTAPSGGVVPNAAPDRSGVSLLFAVAGTPPSRGRSVRRLTKNAAPITPNNASARPTPLLAECLPRAKNNTATANTTPATLAATEPPTTAAVTPGGAGRVGELVRSRDGDFVGDCDGRAVGLRVGETVWSVGERDGRFVGKGVGAGKEPGKDHA